MVYSNFDVDNNKLQTVHCINFVIPSSLLNLHDISI